MNRRNELGQFEPTTFMDIEIGEVFLYGRWVSRRMFFGSNKFSGSTYQREYFYKNKKDTAILLADDWDENWASFEGEPGEEFYFGKYGKHCYVDRVKKHIQKRWITK